LQHREAEWNSDWSSNIAAILVACLAHVKAGIVFLSAIRATLCLAAATHVADDEKYSENDYFVYHCF
jgi:hypothetical protein